MFLLAEKNAPQDRQVLALCFFLPRARGIFFPLFRDHGRRLLLILRRIIAFARRQRHFRRCGQARRNQLPGFEAEPGGEAIDGFQPELFFPTGFDLLVELVIQPREFGEFFLREMVALAQFAQTLAEKLNGHAKILSSLALDLTPSDRWCERIAF